MAGEGVIGIGDEDEVPGIGGGDDAFEVGLGCERVAIAAEEELGNLAISEKRIVELMAEALRGKSESGKGVNVCAVRRL